jgi:hypothetical protein
VALAPHPPHQAPAAIMEQGAYRAHPREAIRPRADKQALEVVEWVEPVARQPALPIHPSGARIAA